MVLDSGIASEDNLNLLKQENFKYIVVSNKKSQIDELNWDEDWHEIEMKEEKSLYIKSSEFEDEQYLLCLSERKLKKEEEIYKSRIDKFEKKIENTEEGLHEKYRLKNYDKVLEKIGRLKEKYKVGNLYDIEVIKAEDSESDFYQGVEMIYNQLLKTFADEGIEEILAEGEEFDPEYHEAIMRVESDEFEEGTVVEVVQKGFILDDRVIRPAMVKVAG